MKGDKVMMFKKLVAAGIMATMVTGASLTALAAGPDFDMGVWAA